MGCKACVAKDQTIAALADQIDWLRAHIGTPVMNRKPLPAFEDTPPMHMTEEEEDIASMLQSKALDDQEAADALTRVLSNVTEA